MCAPFVVASWSTKAPSFHTATLPLSYTLSRSLSLLPLLFPFHRRRGSSRARSHSLALSLFLTRSRTDPFVRSRFRRDLFVALSEIDSLVRSYVRSFVRFCLSPPFFSRGCSRLSSSISPCTINRALCAPTRHHGQAEFNGSCLTFYDATTIRHVTRKSSRSSYSRVATTPVRFVGNFRVRAAALPRHLRDSSRRLGSRR